MQYHNSVNAKRSFEAKGVDEMKNNYPMIQCTDK
jgi:hypothetical protein